MNTIIQGIFHSATAFCVVFFCGLAFLRGAETTTSRTLFGSKLHTESALIGTLYDLKQDQKKRSKYGWDYPKIIAKFLDNGWDESYLNQYYKVTDPLYATQIFVPKISAKAAPDAFGVSDFVKPRLWVVHYKGQVAAPQGGVYRFVGIADDTLAVAVNGKTVLVGCHAGSQLPTKKIRQHPRLGPSVRRIGKASTGDWFEVDNGEVIDLDVIVGEFPGGNFAAFLWIEQKGRTYQKDKKGRNILPIFQTGPRYLQANKEYPKFSSKEEIWKCLQ